MVGQLADEIREVLARLDNAHTVVSRGTGWSVAQAMGSGADMSKRLPRASPGRAAPQRHWAACKLALLAFLALAVLAAIRLIREWSSAGQAAAPGGALAEPGACGRVVRRLAGG
jgi:hypothetical protein